MDIAGLGLATFGLGLQITKTVQDFKEEQRNRKHIRRRIESVRHLAKTVHRFTKDVIKLERRYDYPLLPISLPVQAGRLIKCAEEKTSAIKQFQRKYKSSTIRKFWVWVAKSWGKNQLGDNDKMLEDLGRWLTILLWTVSLHVSTRLEELGPENSLAARRPSADRSHLQAQLLHELRTAMQREALKSHTCTRVVMLRYHVDTERLFSYAAVVLDDMNAFSDAGTEATSGLSSMRLSPLPILKRRHQKARSRAKNLHHSRPRSTQRNDKERTPRPRPPSRSRPDDHVHQTVRVSRRGRSRHSRHGRSASVSDECRRHHSASSERRVLHEHIGDDATDSVQTFRTLQTTQGPHESQLRMQRSTQPPIAPLSSHSLEPERRDEAPAGFSATTDDQQDTHHQTQEHIQTVLSHRGRQRYSASDFQDKDSGYGGSAESTPQVAYATLDLSRDTSSDSRNSSKRDQGRRRSSQYKRDISSDGGSSTRYPSRRRSQSRKPSNHEGLASRQPSTDPSRLHDHTSERPTSSIPPPLAHFNGNTDRYYPPISTRGRAYDDDRKRSRRNRQSSTSDDSEFFDEERSRSRVARDRSAKGSSKKSD